MTEEIGEIDEVVVEADAASAPQAGRPNRGPYRSSEYPRRSAGGSLVYLALLLAVLGPNAETILGYGWSALLIAGAALALNLIGYAFGATARWFTEDVEERIAYLFTVSKKEFSIAAAFVAASGLPAEIAVPAAFYAVVQMVTSPVAARLLAART